MQGTSIPRLGAPPARKVVPVRTERRRRRRQRRQLGITHVIFDGAGIYTPAYAGVAAALAAGPAGSVRSRSHIPVRDLFIERGIRGVGGVSGGAIMMALICAGASTREMMDQSEMVDNSLLALRGALLGTGLCARVCVMALVSAAVMVAPCCAGPCGKPTLLVAASRFYFDPTRAVVAGQQRGVTFAELYADSGLELRVGMADAATLDLVVAGHLTTPDMPVAMAVAASATHPGFTSSEGVYWAGRRYIDGVFATGSPRDIFGDEDRVLLVRVVPMRGHEDLPGAGEAEGVDGIESRRRRRRRRRSGERSPPPPPPRPLELRVPVREEPGEALPHADDMVDVGWLWATTWARAHKQ
jgi:predicted acylesterase/phospholipase RssA